MFLALCAAAACSASLRSRPTERADPPAPTIDPVRTGHASVNLTGSWATGSVDEPAAKQLTLHPQCNSSPAHWIIQQDGDSVRAWTMPASYAQGVATGEVSSSTTGAKGLVSGVDVTIGTSDARYLLRYDPASEHLRGTFNGAPFWAVRLEIVSPEGCMPVP